MKYPSLILFLIALALNTNAQNLVPNPSFEEYITCPNVINNFNNYVSNWYDPTDDTPDYYSRCANLTAPLLGVPSNYAGYQQAHSGNAYSGITLYLFPRNTFDNNTREYIAVQLNDTLQKDTTYYTEFYVSQTKYSKSCITTRIGMYFSMQAVTHYSNMYSDTLNYKPQIENDSTIFITDTGSWRKVSGYYKAKGGEKYITIGNFYDNLRTPTMNCNDTTDLEAYVYIDDVSVYRKGTLGVDKPNSNISFNVFPNPNNSNFTFTYNVTTNAQLMVYDVLGRTVMAEPLDENAHSKTFTINNAANGLYFLQVRDDKGLLYSNKVIIAR